MQKQPPNIQDSFLNHARRERVNVTVYLMNGTKLGGRIKSFDRFAIIMENNGIDQMIFKHAISTVVTPRQHGSGHSTGAGSGTPRGPGPAPPRVSGEADGGESALPGEPTPEQNS